MLYIPEGFAHGFQTLEDNTEVFYQMSQYFSAEHARGVRWNDPAFGIEWPESKRIINERDGNTRTFHGKSGQEALNESKHQTGSDPRRRARRCAA